MAAYKEVFADADSFVEHVFDEIEAEQIMGENGYSDELSLDRKDNNGCYCPENCHWVTQFEQANNKRNNRYIQHNGEIHTVAEWGRITGIGQGTILRRLKLGWDADKILTTPVRKKAR